MLPRVAYEQVLAERAAQDTDREQPRETSPLGSSLTLSAHSSDAFSALH